MIRQFTGWHMTAIMVGGFAIVVAVNLLMASLAIGSFGGVVVENSYVASQNFNKWLDQAARENRLGWNVTVARGGRGHLEVTTTGTPADTQARVALRHPLGREDEIDMVLEADGKGGFRSADPLPEGRWIVRLTLSNDSDQMRIERPIG